MRSLLFVVLAMLALAGCSRPQPVAPPATGPGADDAVKLLSRARNEIKNNNAAAAEPVLQELIGMKEQMSRRQQEEVVAVAVIALGKIDVQRSRRLEETLKAKGFPSLK